MKIAITGSEGFIGGRLVSILTAAGHRVLGIDNLSLGQPAPPENAPYDFAQVDICRTGAVFDAFEAFCPDQVVHLAAIHHIPTCERDAPRALYVNVVGTQIVLEAALRIGCGRILFASSGAVYDWCEGSLQANKTPTKPRDVYSVSKLSNEHQLTVWQHKTKGIAVVARLFNTIGPHDRNGHLIPEILDQLRSEKRPCVVELGNTATLRDYIYVDDTASALAHMVAAELEPGTHVFDVGTGEEHSVLEIVDRLAAILGVSYITRTDASRVRRVDRPSQKADISLTVSRLGWVPAHSLEDALRLTVAES
jgi:nucleoside-diphosphate-sugar epimerase